MTRNGKDMVGSGVKNKNYVETKKYNLFNNSK